MYYFAGEVDNFLRELNPSDVHQRFLTSKYCQCVKYDCGCCVLINLEELKIINTIGQQTLFRCHGHICCVSC